MLVSRAVHGGLAVLAVPMTYQGKNGKQYVAVVAGGASALDDPEPPGKEALVVYALP